MEFSAIDFIVGGLILLLGLKGMLNGVIKEVFGLAAIAGGIYLASSFASEFGAFLNGTVFNFQKQEAATLVGFVALLVLSWGGIILLGKIVAKLVELSSLGFVDKFLGILFASGKVFIIFAIIAYAVSSVDFIEKSVQKHTQNSFLFPILKGAGEAVLNIDPDMFNDMKKESDQNSSLLQEKNMSLEELQKEIKQKMQESSQTLEQLQKKVENE